LDIEHIREMVKLGMYETTFEVTKRMAEREFGWDQIEQAILNGRIVRREPKQKPYPKCTILGYVERTVAGLDLPGLHGLYIGCALGKEIIIITAYWEGERRK